jgi:hypothetical protein
VSERHGKESASNAAPIWSMGRVLALFAALVVSLTLTAVASADVSFIKAYGWGVSDGASQFETCTSTCQGGIAGGGAGQFDGSPSVATDSSRDLYVADALNNRIDEFSAAGSFIKAYGWGVSDGASRFETCTSTCQTGIAGGGAGQLYEPLAVVVDPSGDVYVAELYNWRIDEFSAAGSFIKAYGWGVSDGASQFETCTSTCQRGEAGGGAGEFGDPDGVATDSSGDVYVADYGDARIDEFSAAGSFIKAYGWGVSDGASRFETCTSTCQTGIVGGGAGEFEGPRAVATDSSGNVYVADWFNNRIDEFSAAGSFIKAYGWGVSDGASQFETCTSSCTSGLFGGGAGEFEGPIGVATDSSGDVYVADFYNNRIDEFSGSVAASTLAQGPPTSATVTDGAGYSGQLTVTNANGTVTYTETASADSSDVVVDSSGAISAANSLAPGTYTVGGSDSDTVGDTGSWSFTLTVMPGILTQGPPTLATVAPPAPCGTTIVERLICAAKKLKSIAACSAEIAAFGPLKALKGIKIIKGFYNTHKYREALRPVYKLYNDVMKLRFRNVTGAELWMVLKNAKSISGLVKDVADYIALGTDPNGKNFKEFAKDFADLVGVGDCVDLALGDI